MIKRFHPSIDKKLLLVLAGSIWCGVGIMLCNLAAGWLALTTGSNALWLGLTGMTLSLFIYHFGFLKLVKKNSERILAYKDKLCIFAFQPWKSYFIVVIMIGMGMVLRHSPLPKIYLAIIYIGFGMAMILSSIKYFWIFFRISGRL
ncbi:MAG: hypothetical protein AMK71_09755 [Nitrospira bacterium SG8_35_4]|nr:MAG: hypothetical protein AMK71_09755 [Nitrospira bacterium SG8_35_4]